MTPATDLTRDVKPSRFPPSRPGPQPFNVGLDPRYTAPRPFPDRVQSLEDFTNFVANTVHDLEEQVRELKEEVRRLRSLLGQEAQG